MKYTHRGVSPVEVTTKNRTDINDNQAIDKLNIMLLYLGISSQYLKIDKSFECYIQMSSSDVSLPVRP